MNVCMPVNRICMAMVFSLGFLGFKVIWSMGILISIFGLGCFLLGNCWEVVESTLDKVLILLCILPRGRGVWICWFNLRGSWLQDVSRFTLLLFCLIPWKTGCSHENRRW